MSNPKEVIAKLESGFKNVNGFAFNQSWDKNNTTTFKIRKRALETFQIGIRNNIIVSGKISNPNGAGKSRVEISFSQHFLMKLTLVVNLLFGFGLVALLLEKGGTFYILVIGGIVLLVGILIWLDVKKRFDKNVRDYKKLISEILLG